MSRPLHFSDHQNLSEAILGFVHFARQNDLNVGLTEAQEALQAAALGLLSNKDQFAYAFKALLCCTEEETVLFDRLFEQYWKRRGTLVKSKVRIKGQLPKLYQSPGTLVFMGMGQQKESEKEAAKNVSGANRITRLRRTDFSKVAEIDQDYLEEIALKLWQQMSLRLQKKWKNAAKGPINLRRTIRSNISKGGDLINLKRRNKKKQKNRLIILLDVSASMDKYSFYLLRFVWALRRQFESIDAYVFSTELARITDHLKDKDLAMALSRMSAQVHHWSSGTQIGECLKQFNERYAKRALYGRSITIVLSDGLDTGDPQLLVQQLGLIKRRTKKLVWLNPLKGMKGYAPTAKGMSAALPELDIFQSAHNLNSLLALENFLAHV